MKVLAFVIGSFWAGVGGGLFAHLNTYLRRSRERSRGQEGLLGGLAQDKRRNPTAFAILA